MIDIDLQPHFDKLKLLKEYMEVSIEMNANNKSAVIDFWYLYNLCGIIVKSGTMAIPSFTEYLNQRYEN